MIHEKAGSRIRTDDLLITNQLLYQLSYAGVLPRQITPVGPIPKISQVYNTISAVLLKQISPTVCGVEEIHGRRGGPMNGALTGADRSDIYIGSQHPSSRQIL